MIPVPAPHSPLVPLAAMLALWTPALLSASYAWSFGTYYDYGWFVPWVAALLWLRRWRALGRRDGLPAPRSLRPWWIALFLLVPWFALLRALVFADPSWRLPMWLLAFTAMGMSHWLCARLAGWRASASFAWISLLLLSAIPWPSAIEHEIVSRLTAAVTSTAAEWFQLAGRPVERMGDRLFLDGVVVNVTEGCSGVRSFQSFLMATWIFAEWQRMRVPRALVLLVCACVFAFLVNSARTILLARVRFDHGEEAFDRAHDPLGLAAFAVSALAFYFLSGLLAGGPRRTLVRRSATS